MATVHTADALAVKFDSDEPWAALDVWKTDQGFDDEDWDFWVAWLQDQLDGGDTYSYGDALNAWAQTPFD